MNSETYQQEIYQQEKESNPLIDMLKSGGFCLVCVGLLIFVGDYLADHVLTLQFLPDIELLNMHTFFVILVIGSALVTLYHLFKLVNRR